MSLVAQGGRSRATCESLLATYTASDSLRTLTVRRESPDRLLRRLVLCRETWFNGPWSCSASL